MSVNITVNGKYVRACSRNGLLEDPDRMKKEIEAERRKMRIQQVRAASKNIAKKVRTDVEVEKERQLKKIEEIKAHEMEMWRQNVLAQKEKDFRSSIFQIGTAHRTAQVENTKFAKKKLQEKANKIAYKQTKKKSETTKHLDKENLFKNANVQTNITGECYPKPTEVFRDKIQSAFAPLENSSDWEDNSTDSSSDLSQSSSLSLSDSEDVSKSEEIQKTISNKTGQHTRNVPVLLEAEPVNSDTSLLNTPIIEDCAKTSKIDPKNILKPQKTNILNNKENLKSSTDNLLIAPSTSTTAKKRFTQISDLIRQQKPRDETSRPTRKSSFQKSPSKSKSPSTHIQKPVATTKSRFKSPENSRPVSSQTLETLPSKPSTSSRSTNTRVQFYDYNNKFNKQYDQPSSVVEMHDSTNRVGAEVNAMEQAVLEDRLREAREVEAEKLRQKSAERCQKALERQQVRRACEELTAKLDALTKQRPVLPSDNHQYANHRLLQVAKEKEIKLNNAVEDILGRPAVITCPVIDNRHQEIPKSVTQQSRTEFKGLNLGSALTQSVNNSLNSSDSCCSILLGYVDGQSKQISDDIQKYNKQNGETDKTKALKLQNLLNRINRLRENLMKELEKCSASQTTDKDRVQTMMDSINEFRKEHENIVIDDMAKDSIEKREKDLKKKEEVLEKKLREFYEMHKAARKKEKLYIDGKETDRQQNKTQKHTKRKEPEKHNTNSPDEANDREENRLSANERQSVRKDQNMVRDQESTSSSEAESENEFVEQQKLVVSQKPVEIVIKVKGDHKTKKVSKIPSKSPRKLSTLIQSPTPKKCRRKFTTIKSIDSNSTSYRSLPPKIHNNVDKLLKSVPKVSKDPIIVKTQSELLNKEEDSREIKKKNSNLNPLMAHYVQRLLGMSRTSINALGVTSSDIETPSSSIINTTANLSATEVEKLASSRLENVQKFIEDNYSFIGELEESLRQSSSTDSSLKTIEIAWKKALKEQKSKKGNIDEKRTLKPSLKNTPKKQKTVFEEDKRSISLVDKSTQKTDNCTQRIAELTEMINKVRKEKQKILETTLSSASENGQNSTEYLDLPDRGNNSGKSTSRILDSQLLKSSDNLPAQSPEAQLCLEKDKLTGMSRDSGISLSRPITVQEVRESPVDDMRPVPSSTETIQFKKPKPPISITRYSPQLPEDIPHELSTIFEVDTPATSRLNTSIHAPNVQEKDHKTELIAYKKFPSFQEYVKMKKLDMTQFDPEFSVQFEKEFNEFINLAKEGKVADYEEFTSFNKYLEKSSSSESKEATQELLASLKLANLSYKQFPTRKEYLEKMGVQNFDLLDSQSLDNVDETKPANSNSSSSTSMMNIENELKIRDILKKSFQHKSAPSNDKVSNSITSSSHISQSKRQGEISGIKQFTMGETSTDELSANLEEDLNNMGIKWPSIMKKKILETQALSSSTSTNMESFIFTPRKKPSNVGQSTETATQKRNNETTKHTDDSGQQLNLREFLKKELLKRTTTSSSFSFSDDSVASSILRSILGSITPSGRQHGTSMAGVPTLDRHKTSTPMASQSMSSAKIGSKSQGGTSSVQLFSGESRLSSVHFNCSSKNVNNTAEKNVDKNHSKQN